MAKAEKERKASKKPRLRFPMLKEEQKRFVHGLLILFAAFLTFGGPTYLLYILQRLAFPRLLILLFGLASFTAGIILFAYLLGGERKIGAST